MKKDIQREVNNSCVEAYNLASDEYVTHADRTTVRLRNCQAKVVTTKNYRFLISYNTLVCFIDLHTGISYDILRYIYGYTSTSAHHIAKFNHDYAAQNVLTYRPV